MFLVGTDDIEVSVPVIVMDTGSPGAVWVQTMSPESRTFRAPPPEPPGIEGTCPVLGPQAGAPSTGASTAGLGAPPYIAETSSMRVMRSPSGS
nr:hypothetical protein GCM10025699_60940 [Microbacterium flavescens]